MKILIQCPSSSDIKRIQISAWDGNNMATLTGTVDHTPSEITVKWAGLFNPFWLPDRPASFQFAMDNGKLQTATYTTVSGWTLTEEFSYNTNGSIKEIVRSWPDRLSTYKFYYQNNVLDSVAQTLVVTGQPEQTGFFIRITPEQLESDAFMSVMPFDPNFSYPIDVYDQGFSNFSGNANFLNSGYHSINWQEKVDPRGAYYLPGGLSRTKLWSQDFGGSNLYPKYFDFVYSVAGNNPHGHPVLITFDRLHEEKQGTFFLSPLLIFDILPEAILLDALFFRDNRRDYTPATTALSSQANAVIEYSFNYQK